MTVLHGPALATADWVGALTMGGFLAEVTDRFSGNEALVFDDPLRAGATVRWTYRALADAARSVARGLLARSVGRGTRVAILMSNRPEAAAAIFGAAMVGALAVPLSTFSTADELAFLLKHSGATVLLTQTRLRTRDFLADLAAICPALTDPAPTNSAVAGGDIRTTSLPDLRWVAAVGLEAPSGAVQPWEDFLAAGQAVDLALVEAVAAGVHQSDHALIIYSSGTTALPKGVLHHHRATTIQSWHLARIFGRTPATRLWTALPMFWTAGLNTALGATLAGGGCWVMQDVFDPGEALALMARERVTEPYALPHQRAAMEEHADWPVTDLSSLTSVYGTSAFARHPSVTRPDPHWQFPVGYGLTETCASFATHFADTPRQVQKASTGRLLPGNELAVVDPETGAVLGPGQDGEFAIKGPSLMEHYVKVTRDECLDEAGFFHTGDVGYYDDDGYVHWTGRRTEMIKTGMANVSPAELEVAMRACRPVKLARVVGVPDAHLGQLVVMCVTLKDGASATEEEIRAFLAERLASYKVPKRVLFFDEGTIPMTSSDTKVRDAELLAMVAVRLGAAAADAEHRRT